MHDSYGNRKQPIIRLLGVGGIILVVCLTICILLVTNLRGNYEEEVSVAFQEQHESAEYMLDEELSNLDTMVNAACEEIMADAGGYSREQMLSVIRDYNFYSWFQEFGFVDANQTIYTSGTYGKADSMDSVWQSVLTSLPSKAAIYRGFLDAEETGEAGLYMVAYPVVMNDTCEGYVAAIVDLSDLFTRKGFEYQNEMGECYLIRKSGEIILRSEDCQIIPEETTTFNQGIIDYSNGKDAVSIALRDMQQDLSNKENNFVTVQTSKNDNLQISYSVVGNVPEVYFISCYNDNLIDARVQKLVFRCVLSCIFIVVLMIIIILYVWGTAKNAKLMIEKLAYEDPVTKGKNLNYFKDFAGNVMSVFKETPFVIYRFDIANFRYINEAYGHKKADDVLVSCIRSFDSVFSEKELCVRMNADQFLAIIDNDQNVNQRLMQFRKKVNEDARSIGIKYPIRFKTGIYQIKKHDKDIDVMIDRANVARKTLSGDEKEMTANYSDRIVMNMHKIDRIESDMQRALATGEFKVFLQPKWDIYLNCITGAEALVRWIKPDGSMVYPDEFIPIFENNGFVEKLDFYMLEMVCQRIRDLLDNDREVFPISVNQSRLLLHSPDYVSNVEKILKNYNIPKNAVELEITETVFLDERENMIATMKKLKTLGVRLSMDDFGSGYSSLNMLKDVPFDIIKIDREFFNESAGSKNSQWILQKIIEMTKGLDMDVICEGVETQKQVDFLKQIGCRKVQGYFFSKPIAEQEFIDKYCNKVKQ